MYNVFGLLVTNYATQIYLKQPFSFNATSVSLCLATNLKSKRQIKVVKPIKRYIIATPFCQDIPINYVDCFPITSKYEYLIFSFFVGDQRGGGYCPDASSEQRGGQRRLQKVVPA